MIAGLLCLLALTCPVWVGVGCCLIDQKLDSRPAAAPRRPDPARTGDETLGLLGALLAAPLVAVGAIVAVLGVVLLCTWPLLAAYLWLH